MDLKAVEHEALRLSPEDRAKLAQKTRFAGKRVTILYREAGGTVQVLAVAHQRRRPLYRLSQS